MNPLPPLHHLPAIFGNLDIYLFDQLLKGNITQDMKLLDAGCGNGRNCAYLMQAGVKVYGVDASEEAVSEVQQLARSINPALPAGNFVVADLAALPFETSFF